LGRDPPNLPSGTGHLRDRGTPVGQHQASHPGGWERGAITTCLYKVIFLRSLWKPTNFSCYTKKRSTLLGSPGQLHTQCVCGSNEITETKAAFAFALAVFCVLTRSIENHAIANPPGTTIHRFSAHPRIKSPFWKSQRAGL